MYRIIMVMRLMCSPITCGVWGGGGRQLPEKLWGCFGAGLAAKKASVR